MHAGNCVQYTDHLFSSLLPVWSVHKYTINLVLFLGILASLNFLNIVQTFDGVIPQMFYCLTFFPE